MFSHNAVTMRKVEVVRVFYEPYLVKIVAEAHAQKNAAYISNKDENML